ncbi:Inositol monophosphatase 1, partial [Smittium mucronatum]
MESLKKEALEFVLYLLTQTARPTFVDAFWRQNEFETAESLNSIDKLGNAADCVTVADTRLEKLIFGALTTRFPDHHLVGEESQSELGPDHLYQYDTATPSWIVDPIDGTNNFVHHFPMTAISVGLAVGASPKVGVVYMPIIDTLYFAAIGMGAYALENASDQIKSIYPADFLESGGRSLNFEFLDHVKESAKCRRLPLINAEKLGYIQSLSSCA